MFQNELYGAWNQKYRLRRSDNCFLWLLLANSGFGWLSLHLMTLRTPSELRKVSISYDHWFEADLERVVKLCQNSFFSFRNFFDLVDFRAFWVLSGPPESPGAVFASKTGLRAHQIRKQLQNRLKISYQWNFGLNHLHSLEDRTDFSLRRASFWQTAKPSPTSATWIRCCRASIGRDTILTVVSCGSDSDTVGFAFSTSRSSDPSLQGGWEPYRSVSAVTLRTVVQ